MKLLTLPDLADKGIPGSRVTIWRHVKDGLFPTPIQVSPGRIAWIESEVDEWLNERAKHRVTYGRQLEAA